MINMELHRDQIHIQDLLLRTIIGINPDERTKRQDVLINITLEANLRPAGKTDAIADAVNYRTMTKNIITMVEASNFHLVERLAQEIALICLQDLRVSTAQVRLEKPGALRFARSVGVEVFRSREVQVYPHRVFITMGSNIQAETNMQLGLDLLSAQCDVNSVSRLYLTAPVGKTDQPAFLNAAVVLYTPLSAAELKEKVLLPIERQLGRRRVADKNAPRPIDLDIALFNYEVIEVDVRHIPDPDICRFAHIAVPLAEIAPFYVHPETGQTLEAIAAQLPRDGIQVMDNIKMWNNRK
ncbi:MAG: 2-amino-4-hydroxy-6-hydroxymethyldihydropteridine diphosphokinase [Anaerolineae bacterium]|nr:2-amino-4-hydroxy-6-hydroxymethyldihydropteridine diphosphokinase [Anaerolineae bacterium]